MRVYLVDSNRDNIEELITKNNRSIRREENSRLGTIYKDGFQSYKLVSIEIASFSNLELKAYSLEKIDYKMV